MVDYSKLSDFEINCEVAKANKWTSKSFVHEIHSGKWNPCQNAGDAWPIIIDNGITVINDKHCYPRATNDSFSFVNDQFDECIHALDTNPLRAAMIVFLMMQDSKSG